MSKNQIPETFDQALGLVIRGKREAKGLDLNQFAEKLDTMNTQAYRRREIGESVWGVLELIDVCAALKLPVIDAIRLAKEKLSKASKKPTKRKKAA